MANTAATKGPLRRAIEALLFWMVFCYLIFHGTILVLGWFHEVPPRMEVPPPQEWTVAAEAERPFLFEGSYQELEDPLQADLLETTQGFNRDPAGVHHAGGIVFTRPHPAALPAPGAIHRPPPLRWDPGFRRTPGHSR